MTEQEWPAWRGDFLPAWTIVPHKTGSTERVRNDAGIVFLPGCAVAICVLTADNEDTQGDADNAGTLPCARVAKEVYEYFPKRKRPRLGKPPVWVVRLRSRSGVARPRD